MGTYRVDGDVIAQGINIWVRVNLNDTDPTRAQIIGFVQDINIRKNISVQRAEVLGELLPVSIDPTSVQTSVTMKGFVPSAALLSDKKLGEVKGGGAFSIKSFNPNDKKIVDSQVAIKIPYLDFYDKKHGEVIGSTTWAIVTGYTDSSSGKGYVTADVTMESIGYDNGTAYPSEI